MPKRKKSSSQQPLSDHLVWTIRAQNSIAKATDTTHAAYMTIIPCRLVASAKIEIKFDSVINQCYISEMGNSRQAMLTKLTSLLRKVSSKSSIFFKTERAACVTCWSAVLPLFACWTQFSRGIAIKLTFRASSSLHLTSYRQIMEIEVTCTTMSYECLQSYSCDWIARDTIILNLCREEYITGEFSMARSVV